MFFRGLINAFCITFVVAALLVVLFTLATTIP